jgi:hypothetical protein
MLLPIAQPTQENAMASRSLARHARAASLAAVTCLATLSSLLPACSSEGGTNGNPDERLKGQTSFQSAPPGGNPMNGGSRGGGEATAGAADNSATPPKSAPTTTAGRKVEETDLYRLDGNRLFYLNAYRGLMVFDVTNVDEPKLLGRSAIYGSPVEMIVRNGIATIVVADWYGTMENGQPFHGSIVRGLDATDPANIKSLGEARLGGWVRDTRVVGDVLYAVSEDYGWAYGMWDYGYYGGMGGGEGDVAIGAPSGGGSQGPKVVVSSVSFANRQVVQKGFKEFTGYNAIFNVNSASIMLAHDVPSDPSQPYSSPSGKSELQFVDISDVGGAIALRGKAEVNGSLQGYGTDNGRWNLDFADNHYAHVVACNGQYCGNNGYTLSTIDFANPDAPVKASELTIPSAGYNVAARFDGSRLYLAPGDGYYSNNNTTPFQIYDLSAPTAPKLAGTTQVTGSVWNFIPAGDKLFALGSETSNGGSYSGSKIALRYIDVTNAAAPSVIGTSTFGEGWAWTPAAGTFKAFTKDDTQGLVVLPFSGWSYDSYQYNNGVQLIEYTPTSIRTAGAAKTKGWVERGILVKGRVVSLSDMALSVIDYSNKDNPKVIKEMTLARNVVSARPDGATIAQLSSDWWENDSTSSELRVLPIQNSEENSEGPSINVKIDGVNARAFKNGDLAYIVSNVRVTVPCPAGGGGYDPGSPKGGTQECKAMTPQVQVVDLAGGNAVSRGKITLPVDQSLYSSWGWGWGGCYWYDWYNGADTIQIQGNALAFRRWSPVYKSDGTWEADQKLYIVDLANADSPTLASTLLTTDTNAWWGNMRAVGDKLYTSHYEWITYPTYNQATNTSTQGIVRYYLDQIDLSNRAAPKVGQRINVPGLLVGASETDPSLLYTVDYRWNGDQAKDELSVVKIQGNLAYLQSTTAIDGYVGNVFVRGNKAYTSAQRYVEKATPGYDPNAGPRVQLHELDLTDPLKPVDRVSSDKKGWGWLLGVEGDRAIITSGWGNEGVDIYKLNASAAPAFDQFVRTRGWWANSLSRQNDQLFLSSGYWGVQTINLKN